MLYESPQFLPQPLFERRVGLDRNIVSSEKLTKLCRRKLGIDRVVLGTMLRRHTRGFG